MRCSATSSLASLPFRISTGRACAKSRRYQSTSSAPPEFLPLPRALAPSRGLVLLSTPVPPTEWPSHLNRDFPLFSKILTELNSIGIAVNARYDPSQSLTPNFREREEYYATLHLPDGSHYSWGKLDANAIWSRVRKEADDAATKAKDHRKAKAVSGLWDTHEILVCTHGSRDCRCSDRGGPLVDALREEIRRRGVESRVKVGEVAHVGGHKYAANAILLPSLDMLSNLTAEHAPALLTHILEGRKRESGMWTHWRGRYGLSEADQAALWAQVDPEAEKATSPAPPEKAIERVKLRFRTFEGEEREVDAALGENLLAVGKANSLPALEGVCGGNLAPQMLKIECATCHLYLPPDAPVDMPSEDELDMLSYAIGWRAEESRLGCQIKVTPELAKWAEQGGVIGLPRY